MLAGGTEGLIDGRYRVERELGAGGMGVVYLAEDVFLRRPVALKLLPARDDEAEGPVSGSSLDGPAAALRREAEALASLQSPHVVQVHAFGVHGRRAFFAMEYVAGKSLAAIVEQHRAHGERVPLGRALAILSRIAEGLDAVHARGLAHRDVKPSNIVIEEGSGRPVLVDFGLAGRGDIWDLATAAGTPHYMAPELTGMTNAPVGPLADVYALACTAFAVLAGAPPFDGAGRLEIVLKHIGAPPPRLSAHRPELHALDDVFLRALRKEPAHRHPSCGAFVEALFASAVGLISADVRTLPGDLGPRRLMASPHVLVVDDDPAFRRFATRAVQLVFYGHPVEISAAGSGPEALEIAARTPPDVVLLDLGLPSLDGVDVLSRLRDRHATRHASVIVVSGRLGVGDRWRFSILGVNEFVTKPVDLEELIRRIQGVADRAGYPTDDSMGDA